MSTDVSKDENSSCHLVRAQYVSGIIFNPNKLYRIATIVPIEQ